MTPLVEVPNPPSIHQVQRRSGGPRSEEATGSDQPSRTSLTPDNGRPPLRYADAGGTTVQHTINIATSKGTTTRKVIECNLTQHRLDPSISRWGFAAPKSYDAKVKMLQARKKVLCNAFYIAGKCRWGTLCRKEHNQILTDEEIAIHRHKARFSPCVSGPLCLDYDCYFGHHCPAKRQCQKPDCQFGRSDFGDLHLRGVDDDKVALRWVEGNEFPEKIV